MISLRFTVFVCYSKHYLHQLLCRHHSPLTAEYQDFSLCYFPRVFINIQEDKQKNNKNRSVSAGITIILRIPDMKRV